MVGEEAVFTGDTLFTGSVGGTQDAFDDLRRSVMDVLMGLPHELVVYPGHSEETRIGREWDENPFAACGAASRRRERSAATWAGRGDPRGLEQRLRRRRQGWVRFRGRDAIVGGSRITR